MNARSKPWYGRWWAVALLIALVIGATGLLAVKALGLRSVVVEAKPLAQPPDSFDYGWWNEALGRWGAR